MQQTIAQGWVEEGIKIGEERGRKQGLNIAHQSIIGMIARSGRQRLGELPMKVVTLLNGINDIQKLEQLFDRAQQITSWRELLESEAE